MSAEITAKDELQLKGKDLLTVAELTQEQILGLLSKAKKIKALKLAGETYHPLKGKTLGMIFEKSSTRTRVSFEAGMYQLGGHALFLSSNDLQIGRGEPISDTAQVLSEYLDAIMIRTFEHEKVEELAKYASIPVINALTDLSHPCQALADLLTIQECKGENLKGLKLAYIGDGNNMAHSLMIAAAKVGMDFAIACPEGYKPNEKVTNMALEIAKETGANILITQDPVEAVKEADAIYTDVWTSMGQEKENEDRMKAFAGKYQVNEELVKHAKDDFIFLHCLPAHRGEEVTAEIIDGDHSVVFQEAGNRLHAQKALLVALLA
ncbi:ornithine carbamoyltransferase [Niallia sp. Krafla_26]|uniref:ornithine carbamoyltransferase n=1 Tax=Niallia sp. Krafla_26 TaxID=3064703 RepID=UPI003D17C795